jgi:DNA-binding transcriptional MerR regulator
VGSTDDKLHKIGEVSRITGFPVKTLRYYEERGLVEPAGRSEAGYRLYGEEEVARLEFIKKAKLLGLTLGEITELVELAAAGGRGKIIPHLEHVLENHLEETERKMDELDTFRKSLLYYREKLFETDPLENCGCDDGVSFCGCLDAVTGKEHIIDAGSLTES